jgi:hypothetical protein
MKSYSNIIPEGHFYYCIHIIKCRFQEDHSKLRQTFGIFQLIICIFSSKEHFLI